MRRRIDPEQRCQSDSEIDGFGVRADRWRTEEGLTNPETQGFVETELIQLRSSDDGQTWQGPTIIAPPLVGPSFELCSPVVPLDDGSGRHRPGKAGMATIPRA